MNLTGDSLGTISVVIELAPSLKGFADPMGNDARRFASRLLQYLNELVRDLALPAITSLQVSLVRDEKTLVRGSYRILINGARCRLPFGTALANDTQAEAFAGSIARAIYLNSELLIDQALSKKILEMWSGSLRPVNAVGIAPAEFHDFLISLVRRGFAISRALEHIINLSVEEEANWKAADHREKAVSGLDATTATLFLKNKPDNPASLEQRFELVQNQVFNDLGLIIPKLNLVADTSLGEDEYRVQLNDVSLPRSTGIKWDQLLVKASSSNPVSLASLLNITVMKIGLTPVTSYEKESKLFVVKNSADNAVLRLLPALTVTSMEDLLAETLIREITASAASFLTLDVLQHSLDLLRSSCPALVDAALARFELAEVAEILRSLLEEQVSIKNLRAILEALLSINGTTNVDHSELFVLHNSPPELCPVLTPKEVGDLETTDYTNCVRMSLKQHISEKHAGLRDTLVCYTVDPRLESRIAAEPEQPFTIEENDRLMKTLADSIASRAGRDANPVIVTNMFARKRLRGLIEKEFPQVAVLCFQELSSLRIQTISQISWADSVGV